MPRTRYSERNPVVKDYSAPSRTKQSFAPECDVNNIIKRYDKDGIITHLNQAMPQYAELYSDNVIGSGSYDFHSAMMFIQQASDAFMGLPADMRARFNNDPGDFLAFVDDPANGQELVDLGLAEIRPGQEVSPAEPAKPAEPAAAPKGETGDQT